MNRVTRGTVVLAAALGAISCKGDPTSDLRNGVDHLIATPSAVFVDAGSQTPVVVEAVDEQGNRVGTNFSLVSANPGITVAEDNSFNLVYDDKGNLVRPSEPTRIRYLVDAGNLPANSGFEIQAGGKNITIPVRVLPLDFAATFSNATPGLGDTVTLSVAAPLQVRSDATVEVGGAPGIVTSVAADGSSISFVPYPGLGAGPVTIDGLTLSFLTSLSLNLTSTNDLTTPSGLTGADDFATAPVLAIPASGQTSTYVDVGTMYPVAQCNNDLGGDCRAYQFTLGGTTTFDLTVTWQGTTDIGAYIYDSGGNIVDGCDGLGNGTGGQPEGPCTITLPADTYTMVLDDFGPFYNPPEAPPAYVRMDITTQ